MFYKRDVLIRHQWDLEVAIQEQLNIREGRPSMFASASPDIRTPQVVNDLYLQTIFTNEAGDRPAGVGGFLGYFVNYIFKLCYNTFASVLSTLLGLFRNPDTSKYYQSKTVLLGSH